MHPRPAGRRRARRLPGRRVRGARGEATHARLGRRHLDRRDQRRADRRQPARAPGRAAARVLGRRLVVSVRRRRCRALANGVDGARDAVNETNATIAMLFGVAGFFSPRVPAAPFQPPGTPAAISYYDTEPLRADARAAGRLRPAQLRRGPALGRRGQRAGPATSPTSTAATQRIDARHIMASGALPPGFPPIEIDGEFYWDGGLVSNTPLQYVLDQPGTPAAAGVPGRPVRRRAARCRRNLAEVERAREGHPLLEPDAAEHDRSSCSRQATLQAARRLVAKLPAAPARRPRRAGRSPRCRCEAAVAVVHLIYRSKHYESQSKDYEFSRASMLEHWAAGLADTQTTLEDPRWLGTRAPRHGVHVFDLTSAVAARQPRPSLPPPSPRTSRRHMSNQLQGQDRHRHRRRQRHRQGNRPHLRARRRQGRDRRPEHGAAAGDRRRAAAGPNAMAVGDGRDRRGPGQRRRRRRSSKAWGGVDILVSNAGIQIVHPLEEFPFAEWKKMLAIHLDGAFLTTKACLPHMYASGRGGSIIYMGSVHSKEASMLKAPYVTAKHGLIGLAKVIAKEGAKHERARQRHLPGLRAHAAGRQADPRAVEGARHQRGRRHQEGDAEGDRRRRVHDDAPTSPTSRCFFAAFPTNALTGQSLVVSHGWFMQ